MKRLLLFLLPLLAACSRDGDPMTELYRQIDRAIADSAQAVARHEARITTLRRQWATERRSGRRFLIADSLYDAYSAYINDSAVVWAMRCDSLAKNTDDSSLAIGVRLNLVYQYTKSGYFTEARATSPRPPTTSPPSAPKASRQPCAHATTTSAPTSTATAATPPKTPSSNSATGNGQ